jgi:hypothetical protein
VGAAAPGSAGVPLEAEQHIYDGLRIYLGLFMSVGRGSGVSSPRGGPALAQTTCLEKVAFLSQPY